MILGALVGFAAQRWLHVDGAVAYGVLGGILAANFVPLRDGDDAA